MKKLIAICSVFVLAGCGWFGGEPDEPVDRGVCWKMPEDFDKLPEEAAKDCKDGDVVCGNDMKCHSSCSKCPKS